MDLDKELMKKMILEKKEGVYVNSFYKIVKLGFKRSTVYYWFIKLRKFEKHKLSQKEKADYIKLNYHGHVKN